MPVYQPIKPSLPKDYSSKVNYSKIFYLIGSIILIIGSIFFFVLSFKNNNYLPSENKKEEAKKEEIKEDKQSDSQKNNQSKPSGQIYKVQAGDTLYSIGLKFNIDWHKIASANKLKEPYNLVVGQELIIPSE